MTGLGHPYYDLAAVALFLRLGDDVALELAARHDGAPLDDRSRASFRALRQLVGLLCGLTFPGLVDDLTVRPAPLRARAAGGGRRRVAPSTPERADGLANAPRRS